MAQPLEHHGIENQDCFCQQKNNGLKHQESSATPQTTFNFLVTLSIKKGCNNQASFERTKISAISLILIITTLPWFKRWIQLQL